MSWNIRSQFAHALTTKCANHNSYFATPQAQVHMTARYCTSLSIVRYKRHIKCVTHYNNLLTPRSFPCIRCNADLKTFVLANESLHREIRTVENEECFQTRILAGFIVEVALRPKPMLGFVWTMAKNMLESFSVLRSFFLLCFASFLYFYWISTLYRCLSWRVVVSENSRSVWLVTILPLSRATYSVCLL